MPERIYYQDFHELITRINKSSIKYDADKITAAYEFADKAHGDQRRVSGVP